MIQIILYTLAPLVGLIPFEKFFEKKRLLYFSIVFLSLAFVPVVPLIFTDYSYYNSNMNIIFKTSFLAAIGFLLGVSLNSSEKKRTILIFSFVVAVVSVGIAIITLFGSALNLKYNKRNEWKIDNYIVTDHNELGYAGPIITRYTLYELKLKGYLWREVSSTVENIDTVCVLKFPDYRSSKHYVFDKCNKSLTHQ